MGLLAIYIVLALNRVHSVNAKRTIDCFQLIALLLLYRFNHTSVTTKALNIMNIFNFAPLQSLICSKQAAPYGCEGYQNLIGMLMTLLFFMVLYFIAYLVAGCLFSITANTDDGVIYVKGKNSSGQAESLTFLLFLRCSWRSFILLYLDLTLIQTSVALTQILVQSTYALFLAMPFLLIIVLGIKLHLEIVNHEKQTTLMYRARHIYFFIYDELYHLNYIDHVTA